MDAASEISYAVQMRLLCCSSLLHTYKKYASLLVKVAASICVFDPSSFFCRKFQHNTSVSSSPFFLSKLFDNLNHRRGKVHKRSKSVLLKCQNKTARAFICKYNLEPKGSRISVCTKIIVKMREIKFNYTAVRFFSSVQQTSI